MTKTDTLNVTLPSEREIAMTRVFDAPRRLVFEAHTKPELVKRWLLGPARLVDAGLRDRSACRRQAIATSGGATDGTEMVMGGVFREIVAPERLVAPRSSTHAWYPGEAFEHARPGRAGRQDHADPDLRYESRETRDGVLKSGMESGRRRRATTGLTRSVAEPAA